MDLFHIASDNNLTLLKEYKNLRDNPYTLNHYGVTFCHIFAGHNNLEAVEYIIQEYNFDQYTKTLQGNTIWHLFAIAHNLAAIDKAINYYKFDICTPNNMGYTISHFLAFHHLDSSLKIVSRITSKDVFNRTPSDIFYYVREYAIGKNKTH